MPSPMPELWRPSLTPLMSSPANAGFCFSIPYLSLRRVIGKCERQHKVARGSLLPNPEKRSGCDIDSVRRTQCWYPVVRLRRRPESPKCMCWWCWVWVWVAWVREYMWVRARVWSY